MANRISDRMVKAFERFNADLKAFGEETGETFVTLYVASQLNCSIAALETILQEFQED